jgi:hypothetical protein
MHILIQYTEQSDCITLACRRKTLNVTGSSGLRVNHEWEKNRLILCTYAAVGMYYNRRRQRKKEKKKNKNIKFVEHVIKMLYRENDARTRHGPPVTANDSTGYVVKTIPRAIVG